MRKLLVVFLLFISSFMVAQNSEFNYKIKLLGVTDATSAATISDVLEDIFRTKTPFNDTTCCFEFKSKMCVNETGFEFVMRDESYSVLLFDKQEIILTKKED